MHTLLNNSAFRSQSLFKEFISNSRSSAFSSKSFDSFSYWICSILKYLKIRNICKSLSHTIHHNPLSSLFLGKVFFFIRHLFSWFISAKFAVFIFLLDRSTAAPSFSIFLVSKEYLEKWEFTNLCWCLLKVWKAHPLDRICTAVHWSQHFESRLLLGLVWSLKYLLMAPLYKHLILCNFEGVWS